jgi:hypothetical protein
VKLVDTLGLGPSAFGRGGSSPFFGKFKLNKIKYMGKFMNYGEVGGSERTTSSEHVEELRKELTTLDLDKDSPRISVIKREIRALEALQNPEQ